MNMPLVMAKNITTEEARVQVDLNWKGLYKAGGFSLIIAGVLYGIGSILWFYLVCMPANSQAYLQSLAAQLVMALITNWIFAMANILFIPAILGLYFALKGIDKKAMLIALGLLVFCVVLDLGVTEWNTLALVLITQSYVSASGAALQGVYQAAANWGLASLPLATFFSWAGISTGFLITAFVMRKGIFSGSTARLGMIVYGLAIAASFYFLYSVPALGLSLTSILVFSGAWLIAAGRRLFNLGKPQVNA